MENKTPIKKRATSIKPMSKGTFNQIQEYYADADGRVTLPPSVDKIRQRWVTAYAMAKKWKTNRQIVGHLMKIYSITERQAYQDIKNAARLFENETQVEKKYLQGLLLETYKKAMQDLLKNKDWEKLERFGNRIEKLIGLDKPDANLGFDPADLQPHMIILKADPEVIERERAAIKAKQQEMEKEFTDYEEI